MQVPSAGNPLFLRDEALDASLELLTVAQLGMAAAIQPILEREALQAQDFTLLFLICRRPGLSMTELHKTSGMSKQSLSRHIATLVEREMVQIEMDPSDRRRKLVTVRDQARPILDELVALQRRQLKRAFGRVGSDAVEGFRRVLQDVADSPDPKTRARDNTQ